MPYLVCRVPWTAKASVLSGLGNDLHRPGITASQAEIFLDHPVRDLKTHAGLTAVELVVVLAPERTPAGMEEDGVSGLEVGLRHILLLQRRAHIGHADLFAGFHHAPSNRDHVDQVTAGEKRLAVLDAKLLEAIRVAKIRGSMTVVESHLPLVAVGAQLNADVTKAVELSSHLADLGGHELVMVHEPIVTKRASSRATGDAQREYPLPEQRHRGLVVVAKLVDFTFLDPLDGIEHLRGRHVVRGTRLVIGTPFRGPPFLLT